MVIEQHYSQAEVAAMLSLGRHAVRKLMLEGLATSGKRGIYPWYRQSSRKVMIPESAIARYLKSTKA